MGILKSIRRRPPRARPVVDCLETRSLLTVMPVIVAPVVAPAQARRAAHYGSGTVNAKLDLERTYPGPAGPIKVVIHNFENQTYNANGRVNHVASYFESSGGNGYVTTPRGRINGYYTQTIKGSLNTKLRYPLIFSVDSANRIQATTYHPNIPVTITRKLTVQGRVVYQQSSKTTAYFSPEINLGIYPGGRFPQVFSSQINKVYPNGSRLHVNWNLRP